MSEVEFEGKLYRDIDMDAQKALDAVNIRTFRYFPKTKVWMASDICAEHFHINKFYKIIKEDDGPNVINPADRNKDWALYKRALAGEHNPADTLKSFDGNGYYRITLSVIEKDEDGNPEILAGIIEDYDEQMRQNALVQMLSDDFYTILNLDFTTNEAVFYRVLDELSNKFANLLEGRHDYAQIMDSYITSEVIEEERAEMQKISSIAYIRQVFLNRRTFTHEFRVLRGGKIEYIRVKFVNISEGEELTNAIIGYENITKEKKEAFDRLAFYDQITLGPNYNSFSDNLKKENRTGFVVSLDVRSFKMVNEICGIEEGDKVLRKVSGLVGLELMGNGFYGHVNSDHFIFFVPTESEDDVVFIMENINSDFSDLVKDSNIPKISPYFGVTEWKPGYRIEVAYGRANAAMDKVRKHNEKFYEFYRSEDNEIAIEEKLLEDSFESAIAGEEFEVWYQPKYNPVSRELTGAEALIRWRRPDGQLISPGRFIPVFERNGMIRTLDKYVFEKVCRDQKAWMETFGTTVPISINLSRATLYYGSTIDTYKEIADSTGVPTELLPLEITESAAVMNKDIADIADNFFKAGFPLCIDDFGTGYSSLSTLNLMKFDTIKLDKSLIDYVGEFTGNSLIKHTIALAKDLGLKVVAEGVENEYQVNFLKDVNCDNIQGFFFDRPMVKTDFETKLKTTI